ncbi:WD repeat-containing protein [Ceratobasidium sp. AG-Ba]|nr:WD repeat-containing protein [Ceratobasidium sp. AG-Ba]
MFRKRKSSSHLDEATRPRPFEDRHGEPSAAESVDTVMSARDAEGTGISSNSTRGSGKAASWSLLRRFLPQDSPRQNVQHVSWLGLVALKRALDETSGVFEPLKSAVSGLEWCINILNTEISTHGRYRNIRSTLDPLLQDLSTYVGGTTPPVMTPAIIALSEGIKRETERIDQEHRRRKLSRYLEANEDLDQLAECYDRIQMLLERLKLNANISTWKIVDEHIAETRLRALPHSPAAMYRSSLSENLGRNRCTENTRVEVLGKLCEWACDVRSEKIFWLNGMAGTGKTTIAYSLCEWLENNHKLAASFFCSRQVPECRDVNRIVPTIAYQFARFSRPFYHETAGILAANADVHNQTLDRQLTELLINPLSRMKQTLPTDLVVVIDALDECSNDDGVRKFLTTLLSKSGELPSKVFVSSRPNPSLLELMRSRQEGGAKVEMKLHELERTTVQEDIRTYLLAELKPRITLTDAQLGALVKQSGSLFIYAATIVRYIGTNDFAFGQELLESVLGVQSSGAMANDSNQEIDLLYGSILRPVLFGAQAHRLITERTIKVLHTVICAREPLSVALIAKLLGLSSSVAVEAVLRPLLSVLQISASDCKVTTLHESFPDYLLDKSRSSEFYCDEQAHNAYMAELCFRCIRSSCPSFNICGLETSYVFDKDIPNLDKKIESAISEDLFYSSRYWAAHLNKAKHSQDLCIVFFEFFSRLLLVWLEIMNLKGCINDAVGMLYEIQDESKKPTHVGFENVELSRDAWRFAAAFASSPCVLSTPHLYVSTLLFWPEQAPITVHYGKRPHVSLEGSSAMQVRRPRPWLIYNIGTEVLSVKYSSSGLYIVSGNGDGTLHIRNARTGQISGQPLEGHTGSVYSVAYSPDDAYIASGSEDTTVRIWDANTGRLVGQPLKGHTASVRSVVYSPDGAYIASCSDDNTIRIWDAKKGHVVGQPLEGHTEVVYSVAYSPDGAYIASACLDRTVRIWDAKTGRHIGEPLEGHTSGVYSVAYSPDGSQIASASADSTIRIWDVHTGQTLAQMLASLGHTLCVAYSPDGAYIASGDDDATIHIWDAYTGQMVGQPLESDTKRIRSVVYTPDGTSITSASNGGLICIWDAGASRMTSQPFEAHTDTVISVTFSPDGSYIISESFYGTRCVWDAYTGHMLGQPTKCQTRFNSYIKYSPDGTHMVSQHSRNILHIQEVQTKMTIGQLLEGHTDIVWCFEYSPDGAFIASGSRDRTIRVWDARTGRMVGQPIRGHTSSVGSIAYSPDGAYIASGSWDQIILIWDVRTRQIVGQPLHGHTHIVAALAYSPDGAFIVSGSSDNTIRVWANPVSQLLQKCRPSQSAQPVDLWSPDISGHTYLTSYTNTGSNR